jgi:hypothetical protein
MRIHGSITATLIMGALLIAPMQGTAADLHRQTLEAFERYVRATEVRMEGDRAQPGKLLLIKTLPQAQFQRVLVKLRRGEVWTYAPHTLDEKGHKIQAPDGLSTHWVGAAFFPNVTVDQVLAVVQDFDHFKDLYKPEVVRSRLLTHDDGDFRVYLRVRKNTPWVTPTFNIESTVNFIRLGPTLAYSRSYSTRITQVINAETSREAEMTPGHDSGYMWRLYSYWRFQAYEDGVIAEWESITLSRDIPFILCWLVRPFIERLARNTLQETLVATRKAVGVRSTAPGRGQ